MVYVFLAEGFEEVEAVAPIDILRRAAVDVRTVGVGGRLVAGAHGVPVQADLAESEAITEGLEMIVLPGGSPGYMNLEKSAVVQRMIGFAYEKGLWIGAICAAPSILGRKGLLQGRRAVCFPGFEGDLRGAIVENTPVCEDGNIVTARGAGVAVEFGLALAAKLKGDARAASVRESIQCAR